MLSKNYTPLLHFSCTRFSQFSQLKTNFDRSGSIFAFFHFQVSFSQMFDSSVRITHDKVKKLEIPLFENLNLKIKQVPKFSEKPENE